MGNGISQEQLNAHLEKQERLIKQLQAVVEQQAASLESMGSAAVDYTVNGAGEDVPLSADLNEEVVGVQRAGGHSRKTEAPVSDEEKAAGNAEWTEPTEEEERGFMATKPWLGSMAPPTGWQFGLTDGLPNIKLELEHVYGYRSSGVRQNVLWVDNKTIVYFTAAVGIVHNLETNTQKFFRNHSDDILSIAYHPGRRIVATGEKGKMPAIHIWDVDSCQELAKIAGFHSRGVVSVALSLDGNRVAAVGLDDQHSVTVHEWASGQLLGSAAGDSSRILDIQFNGTDTADSNNCLVTAGLKHIKFWTLANGGLSAETGKLGNLGERQAFLGAAFSTQNTILGTQNGELYVFKGDKLVKVIPAHQQSLFSIKGKGDTLVTGGKDGFVCKWNMNTFAKIGSLNLNKVEDPSMLRAATNHIRAIDILNDDEVIIGTLTNSIYRGKFSTSALAPQLRAHYGDLTAESFHGELWGLSASPTGQRFVTAGEDSTLRLWNCDSRKGEAIIYLSARAQCVAWAPDGNTFAVGLQNGAITFLEKDGDEIKSVTKSRRRISCIKYSPSGKLIAAGTADNVIHVYDATADFALKGKLTGHSSVVLKVDFSEDEKYLQTCAQSYELIFYDLQTMQQHTRSRELKDVKWATFTSILGWDVQGIWPQFSDGSDVNAVTRSRSNKYLATGEDTGLVKIFNYPCVGGGLDRQGQLTRRPESQHATGHAEHVTDVAWTANDKRVISTGGADLSVFQWKVVTA